MKINLRKLTKLRDSEILDNKYYLRIPIDKRFDLKQLLSYLSNVIELGIGDDKISVDDEYIIPEYQRGLTWSDVQKQNFITAVLSGVPIGDFLFSQESINIQEQNIYAYRCIVIDGQQRINCLREFVTSQITDIDGRFWNDISWNEQKYFQDYRKHNAYYIGNLPLKEQIEIYIGRNIGGVAHTDDDIQKAQTVLNSIS